MWVCRLSSSFSTQQLLPTIRFEYCIISETYNLAVYAYGLLSRMRNKPKRCPLKLLLFVLQLGWSDVFRASIWVSLRVCAGEWFSQLQFYFVSVSVAQLIGHGTCNANAMGLNWDQMFTLCCFGEKVLSFCPLLTWVCALCVCFWQSCISLISNIFPSAIWPEWAAKQRTTEKRSSLHPPEWVREEGWCEYVGKERKRDTGEAFYCGLVMADPGCQESSETKTIPSE